MKGAAILLALLTAINLGILGLSIKIYTEYFKDRAISARGGKP